MLSQSTNDRNRDVAYLRLRERFDGDTWREIRDAPVDEIEEAIRPGGISKVKSARIKDILRAITDTAPDPGDGDDALWLDWLADRSVPDAQTYLTSLPGVGRKTAACVLLFALGMRDIPVDTHVSRVGTRLGLFRPKAPVRGDARRDARHHPGGPGAGVPHQPAAPRAADLPRAQARMRGVRAEPDVPERVQLRLGPRSSAGDVCHLKRHSGAYFAPRAPARSRAGAGGPLASPGRSATLPLRFL